MATRARFITMDKLTLKKEVILFLKEIGSIKWRAGNVLQVNKKGEWVDAPIEFLKEVEETLFEKYVSLLED
jgi:hypothetical protein